MDSWAKTVQAIMTPVTSPAPRSSLPPRITHSGATGTSRANPANHSIAEPSSQGMPGTRQTEPDVGTPSMPIRPLPADPAGARCAPGVTPAQCSMRCPHPGHQPWMPDHAALPDGFSQSRKQHTGLA